MIVPTIKIYEGNHLYEDATKITCLFPTYIP